MGSGFSIAQPKKKPKKTPMQQYQEEKERKRQEEAREAAALLGDFVASFDGSEERSGEAGFVRGDVVGGTGSAFAFASSSSTAAVSPFPTSGASAASTSRRSRVSLFTPPPLIPTPSAGFSATPSSFSSTSSVPSSQIAAWTGGGVLPSAANSTGAKAGRRAPGFLPPPLESSGASSRSAGSHKRPRALEELRAEFEQQESLKTTKTNPMSSARGGSFPMAGDRQSTNLHVGNLNPQVTEIVLFHEFSVFGPVASVKIMWPYDDEQRMRGRNTGFVCFLKRVDAEAALLSLNGKEILGFAMRIGWSKPIPVPPLPLTLEALIKQVGPRGQATPTGWSMPGINAIAAPRETQVVVTVPDEDVRVVIDRLASHLATEGPEMEMIFIQRECNNPKLAFLVNTALPENTYYRWKVHSLRQGDTMRVWKTEPFQLIPGGSVWIPPPCEHNKPEVARRVDPTATASTAASSSASSSDAVASLDPDLTEEFEAMLRSITTSRALISDAMVFAISHANCAHDVVEIAVDSLVLAETPVPRKLARLFFISDVLLNSTAPVANASAYRTKLGDFLPEVMESFNETYRSVPGRLSAENMRKTVVRVLHAWNRWSLFPASYLEGLMVTFLRTSEGTLPSKILDSFEPVEGCSLVYAADAPLDSLDEVNLEDDEAGNDTELRSVLDEEELRHCCKRHAVFLELSREEKLARLRLIRELHELRRQQVLSALELTAYTVTAE